MRTTHAGMILGTAAYMAPEQAAGRAVDKRADIWAFGVVLFEMLSGEHLFKGDSVADILADVLRAPIEPGQTAQRNSAPDSGSGETLPRPQCEDPPARHR
jgi:serine/threonine protein kinase